MRSIFDDFNEFFEMGFGKPKKVIFNTSGLKDMYPAIWQKTEDGGYKATVKTLGIEKVNVTIEEYGIKVFGENTIDSKKYDTTIELPIAQDVMDNVVEIKHSTIAGITVIELAVDRPERRKIKITSK